jgi:hypothetical protein
MRFSKNLLFNQHSDYDSSLNGSNIKGSYSSMQFVLRLRDDIRTALNQKENTPEKIQASSTVLHENIHWWQHIGSNFGFIFSLSYPAYAHLSTRNLRNLISEGLTKKSLIAFDSQHYKMTGLTNIRDLNHVLNNYYDLFYAKLFAFDNKKIHEMNDDKRFFLNLGHCYNILWTATVEVIAGTIDKNFKFLPNTHFWHQNFKTLEKDRVSGFYVDSPLHISPFGIHAIYEAQASFNQMQYLCKALGENLTFKDFENEGMHFGIYRKAFDLFLQITKIDRPERVLSSEVALFLLVCDLSINPNNGFPLDIYDYKGFIVKNDPGLRFWLMCQQIAKHPRNYVNGIKNYSKDEYTTLSKGLNEGIGCKCPYESIQNVLAWRGDELEKILKEEESFKFSLVDLPIRLLFSKYYRFQEDKYKHPNIFCWIGYHATGLRSNENVQIAGDLFRKHHALFIDDFDGEIKPMLFAGRQEEDIKDAFDLFYNHAIFYEMIMEWVAEEGPFQMNFEWLANSRASSFVPLAKELFEKQFGISIDKIIII